MTCFYFVTRKHLAEMAGQKGKRKRAATGRPAPFFPAQRPGRNDGRGAAGQSALPGLQDPGRRAAVHESGSREAASRYALTRLKPSDGIIVGMFPWAFDEIGANAGYTRQYGVLPPWKPA